MATLEGAYDENFNCFHCLTQYSRGKRDYEQHKETYDGHLKKAREQKGCFESSEKARYISDNIHWFKCIGNFRSDDSLDLVTAYENYKRGVLPYPGSFMDQPAKVIDCFEMIGQIVQDKVKEREERDKAKRKTK